MRVDFAACEHHFADHLAPIWHALHPDERGTWHAATEEMAVYAAQLGVDAQVSPAALRTADPLLIASYGDMRRLTVASRGTRPGGKPGARTSGMTLGRLLRPVAFLEHGAGQTYVGVTSPSYSGGSRRGSVGLYLAPGRRVAEMNTAAYPASTTAVVGCPKLDAAHAAPQRRRGPSPVVAVSFHWDAIQVAPEAVSAFEHYRAELTRLAALTVDVRGFELIGHAHPKRWADLSKWWASIGVEPVQHFADVVDRADVYCVDNSSTLYEFASLDRPVVAMNAPWYRRDVEHGLRFWSHAQVGVTVNLPAGLGPGIAAAIADRPATAAARRRIVADVYDRCDGGAAGRAADALRRWSTAAASTS